VVSRCTQHSFKHGHNARPFEYVCLVRILFENLCEGESLDRALAVVIDKWPDSNMRGMVVSFLDCKESWARWIGRTQAQVYIEKRARRSGRRVHGHRG
jgi:hypothetical protein